MQIQLTMAHFAHYVQRTVVEVQYQDPGDPWFAENQPADDGFESPVFHVSRSDSGPASRIAPGDTIWLFAQLSTPWMRFPPALDAKIAVAAVAPANKGFRYAAGTGSRWFPLADASPCVKQLRTVSASGATRPLLSRPEHPIGQALQSIRQLSDPAPLLAHEQHLTGNPYDFVSYRLIDGTGAACRKAAQLVAEGGAIFWDRWSLPRRLAERREFLDDDALDDYITKSIRRCHIVWGIASPLYGVPGSYSSREKEEAERLRKLELVSPEDPNCSPVAAS